jgi:hypothetical protein
MHRYLTFLVMPLGSHPSVESRIEAMRKREHTEGPRPHANAPDSYKQHVMTSKPGTLVDATQAQREILASAQAVESRATSI